MTAFASVFMCLLGILFLIAAFFARGLVAPFSGAGPIRPISATGRVIIFVVGFAVLVSGIHQLLLRR